MLIRPLPWCLTSSDRWVTISAPSNSELNQSEELHLEIDSRFRSSNRQTFLYLREYTARTFRAGFSLLYRPITSTISESGFIHATAPWWVSCWAASFQYRRVMRLSPFS
jgi:hypothetical protein